MDRRHFEYLRDLPDKRISADIRYSPEKRDAALLVFDRVPIDLPEKSELVIFLNGTYNRDTDSITFNVHIQGLGPVCRVDVNGTNHKDQGRTHKHALRRESCPRKNLPEAVRRDDLEGKSPREVFVDFCSRANITFTGVFVDP